MSKIKRISPLIRDYIADKKEYYRMEVIISCWIYEFEFIIKGLICENDRRNYELLG